MKQNIILRWVFLFLIIATPTFASYEENIREGIFLVRPDNEYIAETTLPTYLENEDLIFFACLENEDIPLRLSVLCQDTNEFEDIASVKWGEENCYLGATNLEKFSCSRAIVQADYLANGENLKLQQEIRINKFSNTLNRIIESQFTDGGWETPLDTAFGVFALNHFPEIFPQRISQSLEYLKLNRDGDNKCWPQDSCKISTTAAILFLLDQAGFEDLRIQKDGQIYLQNTQNFITTDPWQIEIQDHRININNSVNTNCVYEYQSTLQTLSLSKYPQSTFLNFTPSYEAHIGAACTENVNITLYNQYGERKINYQGDNFSFTIPPGCWTSNNENISCDSRSTLYSVNTPLSSVQSTAAKNYLVNQLVDQRVVGKHIEEDWNYINDALYLMAKLSSYTDVEESLLYEQSNEGGWVTNDTYYSDAFFEVSVQERNTLAVELADNVSKSIVNTGFVVMSLIENGYETDDEVLLDAQRWISLHEDETGLNDSDVGLTDSAVAEGYRSNRSLILNDTKRNAMAFYVLQNNARPVLVSRPKILFLNQDELQIDILNPTIFELEDLEYELSDSLKDVVSVEDKDYIDAYSFRRVALSKTREVQEDRIGYLRILQGNNEYFKVPIILETSPELSLSLPEDLTIFGSTAVLPFKLEKSSHTFDCTLEWETEGISSQTSFDINEVNGSIYSFPVRFAKLETEQKIYAGNVSCVANKVSFIIPFATRVSRFSNRPIKVLPGAIEVLESLESHTISIENALDQTIDVTVSLNIPDPYVSISDPFLTLFPGEIRNISVEVIPPSGEGYNASNSIVLKSFNIEERVLLDVVIPTPESGGLGAWVLWSVIGLVVLGVGVGGYYGYKRREELRKWYEAHFKKQDIRAQIIEQVHEIEQEEQYVAIRNMLSIFKMQGLKDVEIRNRLLAEGYTDAEIDAAIASRNAAPETQKAPQE